MLIYNFSFNILPITAKNEHFYVKIMKNLADNIITASLDLTFHAAKFTPK